VPVRTSASATRSSPGTDELSWILRGEDAYEGLTAVLMREFAEGTFSGVLFEGDIPEAPPVPESQPEHLPP
jgi:hypothetical protein